MWRDGVLVAEDLPHAELAEQMRAQNTLVWVDLVDPSPADLEVLARDLGLSAGSIEDAMAPHERPKVVRHPGYLFFQTYATAGVDLPVASDPQTGVAVADVVGRDGTLSLSRVSGYVLPQALVTVRLDDRFDMSEVVRRWTEDYDLVELGEGALLHGLLDTIVDGHFDTIQRLDDAIEALEDLLFEDKQTGADFARTIFGLRKDLVQLRRVVLPMREVVNGLLRHRPSGHSELDSAYDDLYDHVLRAAEWTESLRDMVTTLFETNLSLQDAHLNIVMRKLAGWAAIIAVPTAITGWFGQNVPYWGFQDSTGLWASVVLIAVLSVGLFAAFRRNGWV
ncbi:putative metal ion transport protein [Kineosphaera limosa NBRC 100340]|uniref:Putative metal ion transport protein n=1 Tax=Kineosphaera limosa NBRC 100340 TaxID=1184609 RepID=K6WC44_9MICO|nr:putative metal ion transport protein [Kineosphaera limosa NBRC 100340]